MMKTTTSETMKSLNGWHKNHKLVSPHNSRQTEFLRFLLVGGFNTLSGYAVYLFFLWLLDGPIWAYNISYAVGIIVSYCLNVRFTFRQKLSWKKFAAFPLVYVVQYVVGLLVLKTAITAGIPAQWAGLLVIAVTIPITFFMSRFLLR